jgi:hypothetical protein
MTYQSDADRTRTLWKYFFPPEKYSLHEVCARARYINHSAFALCLLAVFYGHTSNGVLSSIQTAKVGSEYCRDGYTRYDPVTDLRVSPKHSPLSLGYTNTCGPRGSCAPSGKRNCEPDGVRYGVKDVGTQFMMMIASGVGGCWGRGRCPESFSHLIILIDRATQARRSIVNYPCVAEGNVEKRQGQGIKECTQRERKSYIFDSH